MDRFRLAEICAARMLMRRETTIARTRLHAPCSSPRRAIILLRPWPHEIEKTRWTPRQCRPLSGVPRAPSVSICCRFSTRRRRCRMHLPSRVLPLLLLLGLAAAAAGRPSGPAGRLICIRPAKTLGSSRTRHSSDPSNWHFLAPHEVRRDRPALPGDRGAPVERQARS